MCTPFLFKLDVHFYFLCFRLWGSHTMQRSLACLSFWNMQREASYSGRLSEKVTLPPDSVKVSFWACAVATSWTIRSLLCPSVCGTGRGRPATCFCLSGVFGFKPQTYCRSGFTTQGVTRRFNMQLFVCSQGELKALRLLLPFLKSKTSPSRRHRPKSMVT